MTTRQDTLADRIAFAQHWLDRARGQLEDGDVARGALTMLLAEAELHRAREFPWPPAPGPARARAGWARSGGAAVGAAAVLAAAIVAFPTPPAPEAADGSPPRVLTLSARTGEMLQRTAELLEQAAAPPAVNVTERTVVRPVVVRVSVPGPRPRRPAGPAAVPAAQVARAAPGAGPLPGPAAPAPVEPAPAVAVVPPAPVLSEADVIDLVLAAERSLRRTANQ